MSGTLAPAGHKSEAQVEKAADGGARAAPEATVGVARFLEGALRPVLLQRQGEGGLPPVPHYELTPPSLLQPPDPYARFRPDLGLRLRLDPALEARIMAQGRSLLSPASVLASVAAVAPSFAVPRGAAPPGAVPGTMPGGGAPTTGGPAAAPPTPAAGPASPTPGAEPEGTRPGSGGDVVSAVLAHPQVHLLLEDVQNQFTSGFSRYWSGASTGERVGFVSASVVVGAGMLAPLLGFREPRDFVLPLLNDVVIPVPGLSGYGLEFRFGEHDVMIGAHLDVGRLLPAVWGFGEASFSPIGGPPGSGATGPPPVARKAEDGALGTDAQAIAGGVRAQTGGGFALDEGVRRDLEPALATDLAGVRVHTDARADTLARSVHARAFTSGRDLFFRSGRYDPGSAAGRRLLAHELVHVGQQARGEAGAPPAGSPLRVSQPHDRHEREADRIADSVTSAPDRRREASPEADPVPGIQRQPEPGKAAGPSPVPAAAAQQMKPPPFTSYFDEMVPAILEAAEGNKKVGLERALWLITQAYGEQGPSVGLPSEHHNRLFNEQGAVEMEDGHIKRVLPNQESEGVKLYNLPQNESPERGKQDIKTSPTFGYDTPERSAHHHLEQMQSRWGGAWNALTAEKGSFEDYARSLKRAGYAKAADYDTYLINLQAQVRSQVSSWLRFRIPELRDQRIPRGEEYLEFLRSQRDLAARRAAEEPDPAGFLKAEVASYDGMIQGMEIVLADARAQLARLQRFAGVLGVKVPQGGQ